MKEINYNKSTGTFKIKYLSDNEIYSGSINIDGNSIKTFLAYYIINRKPGDIFRYYASEDSTDYEEIELLEKDITVVYDEIEEDNSVKSNPYYNEIFKNIKNKYSFDSKHIYFQFYYRSIEHKISDTISNKIILGLKRYPNYNYYEKDKSIEYYILFKSVLLKNFLKRCSCAPNTILCCVPSHNASNVNNNSIAIMINEICSYSNYVDGSQYLLRNISIPEQKMQGKRFIETHLNSIVVVKNVKDKDIILLDDIVTSGSSLLGCKKLLLDAGAKRVVTFAFSKSS